MPVEKSVPQQQRRTQSEMKARLTIYWTPTEPAQLDEILKELDISPYRFVKDCVQYLTALIHAIKREDAPQIWNTLFGICQKYSPFELNLNSIFIALRDLAPFDLIMKNPLTSIPHQKTRNHAAIPLLRPE